MKKTVYFILFLTSLILPLSISASGNGITQVASEIELENCLHNEAICKLTNNIAIQYSMGITKDTVLDLNGHTISPTAEMKVNGGFIVVEKGSQLTVNDSTGKGIITTGKDNKNVWAAIQLLKEQSSGNDVAELIVNGGIIEGYYYGIVGNEKKNNTKVTINGGAIKGLNPTDSVGIYQPQIGEIIINGGIIKGGSGIEIRSGNLIVNDGTIEGIAPTFTKSENQNSYTTNGVGIAIAQHTTKKPINISIRGGNISGQYALYEWNPHNNSQDDLNKIKIEITNGDFKSTSNGGLAIYSQNFKKFITGGKFNSAVTEYLADDAKVASKTMQEIDTEEDSNSKAWIIFTIGGTIAVGISGVILWKRKFM